MKVLILSTYEKTGGAAIATSRLLNALRKNGVDANMLCRKDSWLVSPSNPLWLGKPQSWSSIMERLAIWVCNGFSTKNLWATDIGLFGQDITKTKEYKEADVIHLHWVNQGFLSLKTIGTICRSGKKVVWTMHDEWPLDAIFHYTDDSTQSNWLTQTVFRRKQQIYNRQNITFVACSQWLCRIAKNKLLGKGQQLMSIPNCIDTSVFEPVPHSPNRRVLFVSQNVNDDRKGIRYLNEATELLDDNVEIIALGRDIPYINNINEMAKLYASVDTFVIPSLHDNLPNTIMEAMACGVPCVGFNVGGIPEMIDHKENGYVAKYKDAQDLAEGIRYVLSDDNHDRLSKAAREKVLTCYSEEAVAKKYKEVYEA